MTGFGSAIIGQVIWNLLGALFTYDPLIGNIQVIYPALMIAEGCQAAYIFAKNRGDVRWDVFWVLTPSVTVMVLVGNYILVSQPPAVLGFCIGFFFVVFASYQLLKRSVKQHRMNMSPSQYKDEGELVPVLAVEESIDGDGATASATVTLHDDEEEELESVPMIITEGKGAEQGFRGEKVSYGAYFQSVYCSKSGAVGLGAGLASGLLEGIYGMGGPPIIFFYSGIEIEKNQIRASNAAISLG